MELVAVCEDIQGIILKSGPSSLTRQGDKDWTKWDGAWDNEYGQL